MKNFALKERFRSALDFYRENQHKLMFVTWQGVSSNIGNNFTTANSAIERVNFLITTAIGFGALVAVAVLVYGGYMFASSGGDPEKIETGQKSITAAITGLVIIFIARMIVFFVFDEILKI